MKKIIVLRHLINDEDTLKEYWKGMENIIIGRDLAKKYDINFDFGLKLTADGNKINKSIQRRIYETNKKLPSNIWQLYDTQNRGLGDSYRQILFNTDFLGGIVACADLDQFQINSRESLKQIAELFYKVEKDNALYAIGSRDVPVVLATNKRNSDIRIIHELFHSLAIGSGKLKIYEQKSNVTPAYARIGESTSGFSIINQAHPAFPDLGGWVNKFSQMTSMRGPAIDYAVAIKSAQMGKLARGYVKSYKNKFYKKRDEREEFEAIKKFIVEQERDVGKTDIKNVLLQSVKRKENTKRLSEFYPLEDVKLVRDLMIDGLEIN